MKDKILKFLEAHPVATGVICFALLALLLYAGNRFNDWRHTRAVNHQDQQTQKQIDANAGAAASSESNANTHAGDRQAAEGRAELANQQKQQAAANSNRSFDSVRKARQRDQETSRSSPADSPDLSDEQLCAELTKRGIPCK